jgi:glyoxylase-like metal-dependent hydrolase (beta-lactamase superfamily II)
MEIRPGLHRVQAPLGPRFVALYLLVGDDAAMLVDTGIRESITETLLPYLDAAGIPREKLRWAVNTHCDYDHTGGNGALKAAIPSVEILAHALDAELVEDVQRLIDVRYGEFRDTDGFDDPPETTAYLRGASDLVPVDRRLAGGEEFDLGGRAVRVLHVPGHSPGHVAVHDPENRALMIGDATLGTTVPFADGRAAFPPTSNLLFWSEAGYFDEAAELKPLLHTWSLAVEEQFYIVFPRYLLALARLQPSLRAPLTFALCVLSLVVSEWLVRAAAGVQRYARSISEQ